MATVIQGGPIGINLKMDKEGNRVFSVTFRVRGDYTDGPLAALATPGLPATGDPWTFGNEIDPWSFCKIEGGVEPEISDEPNRFWKVTKTFVSAGKDKDSTKRCKEQQIDDPLLKPQEVSGGWVKYMEEAVQDRNGTPILNSAWEQFHGPLIEFDANRDVVRIKQNVPDLQLALCESFKDVLNDAPLWGMPARCIKVSNFSWDKAYYGNCYAYYVRSWEFEIRTARDPVTNDVISGFDRDLTDEGSKVISGQWFFHQPTKTWHWKIIPLDPADQAVATVDNPDRNNPSSYIRFKDRNGDVAHVILDGYGYPAGASLDPPISPVTGGTGGPPGKIHIEKYDEGNLLLLGIPTTF